jgi:hypothetical protein
MALPSASHPGTKRTPEEKLGVSSDYNLRTKRNLRGPPQLIAKRFSIWARGGGAAELD